MKRMHAVLLCFSLLATTLLLSSCVKIYMPAPQSSESSGSSESHSNPPSSDEPSVPPSSTPQFTPPQDTSQEPVGSQQPPAVQEPGSSEFSEDSSGSSSDSGPIIIQPSGPLVTAPINTNQLPPVTAKPDLVITSISRYEAPDLYSRVKYTIKNQGAAMALGSTAKLYANGVYKASDSVPPIGAGASIERQFINWNYNLNTPVIKVIADDGNAIAESNETNNEKTVTFAKLYAYDFIANAPNANWSSLVPPPPSQATSQHYLTFGDGPPQDWGSYGTDPNDPDPNTGEHGYALYRYNKEMEDGNTYAKIMLTYPLKEQDGMIEGSYNAGYIIKPGDILVMKVGFLKLPSTGASVIYTIDMYETGNLSSLTPVFRATKLYNGNIYSYEQGFPSNWYGKKVNFLLRVYANGSPDQDCACWLEAKIVR